MAYDLKRIDLAALFLPVCRAAEALARLDECVARSAIRIGFLERQDFADAVASMWVDGELVHVEDLVLHDARRDARTPTHELTIAHSIVRLRRQIAEHPPGWSLGNAGLSRLRGRLADQTASEDAAPPTPPSRVLVPDDEDVDVSREFEDDYAEIDALIERSNALLDGAKNERPSARPEPAERDPLVYEPDWDEDQRIEEWLAIVKATHALPGTLRAAIALDAWNQIQVLQHKAELGRLLAADLLRQEGVTLSHLPSLNVGLKSVRVERRRSPSRMVRLNAILEGFEEAARIALKEHDRLVAAREQLGRRVSHRRGHSRLPQLIDLVIARPVVSASLIAKALDITPQGALLLTKELNLREMTGRGRYRAWGVL